MLFSSSPAHAKARRPVVNAGCLIDGNGQVVRDLTEGGEKPTLECATWSHSGGWLAYSASYLVHSDSEDEGLFITRPDGKVTVRLTSAKDDSPAWSPDEKQIAFVRYTDNQHAKLCLLDVATRQVHALTDDKHLVGNPSWSHDGTRIVFDSDRLGTSKLWMLTLSDRRQELIPHQPVGECAFPAWSPTEDTILFVCGQEGKFGIPASLCRVSSRGERRTVLPVSHVVPNHMAWSQDGQRIAFTRYISRHKAAIFTASPYGTQMRQLYPWQGGSGSID